MVLCMGRALHIYTQWTLRLAPDGRQNFRAVPPKSAIAKSRTHNPGAPHPRARSALLVSQVTETRTTKGSRVGSGRFTLPPAPAGGVQAFSSLQGNPRETHPAPGVRLRWPH
jgi:hypothetical protein